MQSLGYRAVKSQVCVKKSKMAINFFVTKATDLKIIFLKIPCLSNFFNELALKNWSMNMYFNSIPIL